MAFLPKKPTGQRGRDFYAFLGIPNDSDEDTIRRTCMRLAKRWQAAIGSGSLSAELTANAEQLLTGSQLVWRTLTDPEKKAEYDRRLANGRAPIVESTTGDTELPGLMDSDSTEEGGGTTAANTPLDQANELMAQGQFGAAVPILNKARLASPSDPDVLAALGWASLRAGLGDSASEDESAEDYIRLALTFDPGNLRALEYYARLAVEQGNITAARKRLQRYIARAPNAAWARKALAELPDGDPDDGKGKGRRIWRRGGDR